MLVCSPSTDWKLSLSTGSSVPGPAREVCQLTEGSVSLVCQLTEGSVSLVCQLIEGSVSLLKGLSLRVCQLTEGSVVKGLSAYRRVCQLTAGPVNYHCVAILSRTFGLLAIGFDVLCTVQGGLRRTAVT